MSADAKIWFEPADDGGYGRWHGFADPDHEANDTDLTVVADALSRRASHPFYWYPRVYPDGQAGLVGYSYPRKDWEG